MEINKQLFEDVLSGKLKGTFVLRNGEKYDSSSLHRNSNKRKSYDYPYALYIGNYTFVGCTTNGKNSICLIEEYKYDIIDFIPDTDMKENELTIEIPKGKIVDWDESKKQNKIVLKDKQLTYEEICRKLMGAEYYYINSVALIHKNSGGNLGCTTDNTAASEHQLECILAKNKLANVAKYLNDGWKPSYNEAYIAKSFVIEVIEFESITIKRYDNLTNISGQIVFKSEELAQQAIEILGEEIVKLALEPIGI